MLMRLFFSVALLAVVTLATGARAADPPAPPAIDADLAAQSDDIAVEAADGGTGKTLQERIRAVSRRVFLKRQRFELEPLFGFTANDGLNRFWSFGARGAWHFNEDLAIDFGGAGGFNQPLQDVRIIDGSELVAKDLKLVEQIAYADVGVTFSPFYGKFALLAEEVVHFDGFISGGLGVIVDNSAERVHPALELGVGARAFLTRWLTVRADLRNYAYPLTVGTELTFPSALMLTFGLGVHLPFDFDYASEIIGAKG